MKELVFKNNGQIVTNSLLVAEKFEKEHKNVLSAIESIFVSAENSAETENQSLMNLKRMFWLSEYDVPLNNGTGATRKAPMYLMNRDGFSLLVMGFTGQKALNFKLDFISAFNEMEKLAQNPVAHLSKIDLAQMVIESEREKERLQIQNELQQEELKKQAPKVAYYNEVLQSQSTYNTNQIAKELGMSAVTLNKKLRDLGVQYKQGGTWLLYHRYQNKGYTKTQTYTFADSNGNTQTNMQTVWTEEGRLFIHDILKQQLIVV